MTRRERLEARLEKRQAWAASRDQKSAAGFARARVIADGIPLGQPILVGHHSERRHRADVARIDAGMRQGCESADMAAHHRAKADGLERQLDGSIFSDDPDAVEALTARVAELEAQRARWKAENAAFRKGDAEWIKVRYPDTDPAIALVYAERERGEIMAGYSWTRQPHPAYSLSNLAGNIGRLRKRLEVVKQRQAATAEAEARGGLLIRRGAHDSASVRFVDYPGRAIVDALKAAGFRYSGGAWFGTASRIPSAVLELEGGAR